MTDFFAAARQRYVASNAQTLRWMLARPPLHGVFVNTKVNPLTLVDYSDADGWRGPDHIYGWIQGRGLEAVVTHAAAFEAEDSALSQALDAAGRRLYAALDPLRAGDGHVYFCYDREMNPIRFEGEGCSRTLASFHGENFLFEREIPWTLSRQGEKWIRNSFIRPGGFGRPFRPSPATDPPVSAAPGSACRRRCCAFSPNVVTRTTRVPSPHFSAHSPAPIISPRRRD